LFTGKVKTASSGISWSLDVSKIAISVILSSQSCDFFVGFIELLRFVPAVNATLLTSHYWEPFRHASGYFWCGVKRNYKVGRVMYKKILVPLDGSDLSASVLPYVRWIASTLRTPVELLHVEDVNRLAPYSPPLQIGYLDGIAESFSDGSDVKCTIERGSPAELIIHKASAEPGVLVAMATHGYTGAARWLLGSVTQKALRGLHGDLLTVRPGAAGDRQAALETIIVPLDLSAAAEQVFAAVSDLARRLAVEILLVHVTKHVYTGPPDAFLPVFGAIPNLKELWEHDEAAGAAYLTEKVTELRARGVTRISSKVLPGGVDGAAGEIIAAAENTPRSLIVMTSAGQSGLARWLVGSVTERVVCHSRTPVLVIRAQA
jgi:nucleotide-binding universal stress UspA family protein